jgi:ADP-ribosylglycohydrolase
MELASRQRGCLLGLACGDAVGTTVEFRRRGSFPPVTDMTGGGPFRLPAGAWTDDTSMAQARKVELFVVDEAHCVSCATMIRRVTAEAAGGAGSPPRAESPGRRRRR